MDWSKSKNILIAALLVTNIIIGWFYMDGQWQEKQQLSQSAANAVAYLEDRGLFVDAVVPVGKQKLPVLFLSFLPKEGAGIQASEATSQYKDIPIVAEGMPDSVIATVDVGQTGGRLISASNALLKFAGDISEEELAGGIRVTDIELIYYVDRRGLGGLSGEDTALPTWRIATGDGANVYINAYEE